MTTSLPGKIELNPQAIDLAHQLDAFVKTGHAYAKDFHQHTFNIIGYIAAFYPAKDITVPISWPVDRSVLNNAVKIFHSLTAALRADSHFRAWEEQFISELPSFHLPPRALGYPRNRTPPIDPRVSDKLPYDLSVRVNEQLESSIGAPSRTPTSHLPAKHREETPGSPETPFPSRFQSIPETVLRRVRSLSLGTHTTEQTPPQPSDIIQDL